VSPAAAKSGRRPAMMTPPAPLRSDGGGGGGGGSQVKGGRAELLPASQGSGVESRLLFQNPGSQWQLASVGELVHKNAPTTGIKHREGKQNKPATKRANSVVSQHNLTVHPFGPWPRAVAAGQPANS
jgi:hypothetical protein